MTNHNTLSQIPNPIQIFYRPPSLAALAFNEERIHLEPICSEDFSWFLRLPHALLSCVPVLCLVPVVTVSAALINTLLHGYMVIGLMSKELQSLIESRAATHFHDDDVALS